MLWRTLKPLSSPRSWPDGHSLPPSFISTEPSLAPAESQPCWSPSGPWNVVSCSFLRIPALEHPSFTALYSSVFIQGSPKSFCYTDLYYFVVPTIINCDYIYVYIHIYTHTHIYIYIYIYIYINNLTIFFFLVLGIEPNTLHI
jgi:hypothetical protein